MIVSGSTCEAALDGERRVKSERVEGGIQVVNPHVGHGAVAEIPEVAPACGRKRAVVRPIPAWAEPQVPVETDRLLGRTQRRKGLVAGFVTAAPRVHLAHGANSTVIE